jgi:hypothetical protein
MPKGVRSLTTLGIALSDQPSSGGTYSTTTDFYLDPPEMDRDAGWPATRIVLLNSAIFGWAAFGAELVGAFGWSAVPDDIQGVGIRAVVRRHIGKSGGGTAIPVGPEGTLVMLPDVSGADRKVLDFYRHIPT